MSSNYRQISDHLAALQPFTGNSMSARGDVDGMGYSVYSYETEIARVMRDPATDSFVAFIGDRKYSVTTSKQQGKLYRLPGEHVEVPGADRGGNLPVPQQFLTAAANRIRARL